MIDLIHKPSAAQPPLSQFNFLTDQFPDSDGVVRRTDGFEIVRPWSLVQAGRHNLAKGWWALDAVGELPIDNIEVRLRSASDPQIVLSPEAVKIYLPYSSVFDVDVLISPWPGSYNFQKLQLRKLTRSELVGSVAAVVSRAARSKNKAQKLAHVVRQLRANVPIGIKAADQGRGKPLAGTTGNVAGAYRQDKVTSNVYPVLAKDDVLHPNALHIVQREFENMPQWQAVFCDVDEGGVVVPKGTWDEVLHAYLKEVSPPFFFRTKAVPEEGGLLQTVESIISASGKQAIGRIPLPLVQRPDRQRTRLASLPTPVLPSHPLVSAIIPTKIRIDLLEKCLHGLQHCTDYSNLEVVIVDNGSTDPMMQDVLAQAKKALRIKVIKDNGGFNFSRLVNFGTKHASGEVILLLNDDIEPIASGWLHRMVESVLHPSVGAVGARLLYPDGSIQHAGVALGLGGVCGHMWKGVSSEDASTMPQIVYPNEKMAVTGACLAVRREVYDRIGGFDENAFPVALNDIDFCLRVRELGLQNIYRGDAALIHHESQSRGDDALHAAKRRRLTGEIDAFIARWSDHLRNDPFSSPEFDQRFENGSVHRAVRWTA